MEEKILNKHLRQMAVGCGLCKQWQKDWEDDWDLSKMVDKFYEGIDFYLKTRFIPNLYLKENFPVEFLRKNAILVDDKYSIMNPEQAILIGESESTIRMNGREVSTVYVTDHSRLKVLAKDKSFIIVHALDSAEIEGETEGLGDIVIIRHSKNVKIKNNGGVRIKDELNFLA